MTATTNLLTDLTSDDATDVGAWLRDPAIMALVDHVGRGTYTGDDA